MPSLPEQPPEEVTAVHQSKWPISSEKAMLYECAAHVTRVFSDEVLYIGWKSYGIFWHVVPVGAKSTWPKPLAALDVIEPLWPVVWSLMTICRPCAVSCMVSASLSPEFMNRSALGLGVKVFRVEFTGLGGEPGWGCPLFVIKAKLTYSTPVLAAQVEFRNWPVTGFSEMLSMFSAAHHFVGSQLIPPA